MIRITGGKVYDPANGINGVVQDICIADGRIVARRRWRPHHRRDAAWSSSPAASTFTRTSPAAALNFARGLDARRTSGPRASSCTRAKRRAGIGGIDAHDLRDRLSVRRAWARRRSTRPRCRSSPPSTRTKSCTTRRSWTSPALLLMANNEIVLDLLEAGEVERAKHVVGLADLGGQGLRREGRQPRRRRRLEVGQGREARSTSRSRATTR